LPKNRQGSGRGAGQHDIKKFHGRSAPFTATKSIAFLNLTRYFYCSIDWRLSKLKANSQKLIANSQTVSSIYLKPYRKGAAPL